MDVRTLHNELAAVGRFLWAKAVLDDYFGCETALPR